MTVAIFALFVGFVACNVWVEAKNPQLPWWDHPLSDYLYGVKHAAVQSLGYLGMALAEVLLIFDQPHGRWWTITLAIAATGLVMVVVTANLRAHDFPGRRWLHVRGAAMAFVAALIAEILALRGTPDIWFPIGAAATVIAFFVFAPERSSLQEKAFALWVIVGFVSIVGLPL